MGYEDVVVRLPWIKLDEFTISRIAQGDFRRKQSMTEQLFNINELDAEYLDMSTVHLDIKTAYGCVNHDLLWSRL